jgi:predicted transcriptional regulator
MSGLVEMAISGASSREIARLTGLTPRTVRRRVRKLMPHAFSGRAPFMPAAGAVARLMPHQVGWSTDPVSHHAVSLPKLRCLAPDAA